MFHASTSSQSNMRVAFINKVGGIMLVDESRKQEYIEAGYMLASDIVDSTAVVVEEEVPAKKKTTRKKKEV